jgi:cytidylate kinase
MFNVVTIAREYGSGGAEIGRKVAELLGWECLDKQIIERAASVEKAELCWAEEFDERSRTWWEKVMYGFEQASHTLAINSVMDYDSVQQSTMRVIEEAAKVGNCVIIGRGSQFVLRSNPHVFHAMVYAPIAEKMDRIRIRHPHERNFRTFLTRMDIERSRYERTYYDFDWRERELYHLCLNSTLGLDVCAELIVTSLCTEQCPNAMISSVA